MAGKIWAWVHAPAMCWIFELNCAFPGIRHKSSSLAWRKRVTQFPCEPEFTYEPMLSGAHAEIEKRLYVRATSCQKAFFFKRARGEVGKEREGVRHILCFRFDSVSTMVWRGGEGLAAWPYVLSWQLRKTLNVYHLKDWGQLKISRFSKYHRNHYEKKTRKIEKRTRKKRDISRYIRFYNFFQKFSNRFLSYLYWILDKIVYLPEPSFLYAQSFL